MTLELNPSVDRTSPAAVAYDLMRDILLDDPRRPSPSSDEFRAYLLDLYAECLLAVNGKRVSSHGKPTEIRAAQPSPPPREREKRDGASPVKMMKAN